MNQQRSRRFKSSKDSKNLKLLEEEFRSQLLKNNEEPPPLEEEDPNKFDRNVITPGTKFMKKLSDALNYYIHQKMNTDESWKSIKVILSDSNVPGEGEHKILDFIRLQRNAKNYNPNTSHIIHGLDADLIMLGLISHEPNFTILREKVYRGGKNYDENLKKLGYHESEYKPFNFFHINILREHLKREFAEIQQLKLKFKYDFERIIDDYICLCFLIGNDFLPHLPSLDINEGSIEQILKLYKENIIYMNDYLTNNGKVNLTNIEIILKKLGEVEDYVLMNRFEKNRLKTLSLKNRKLAQEKYRNKILEKSTIISDKSTGSKNNNVNNNNDNGIELFKLGIDTKKRKFNKLTNDNANLVKINEVNNKNKDLKNQFKLNLLKNKLKEVNKPIESKKVDKVEKLEIITVPKSDLIDEPVKKKIKLTNNIIKEDPKPIIKKKISQKDYKTKLKDLIYKNNIVDPEKHPDHVKLGTTGWKQRYYKRKFKIPLTEDLKYNEEHEAIFKNYIEGLCWILEYYYNGVPSWNWFYKYHYAPFASDLDHISNYDIKFEKGKPFKPLNQLMAVFPGGSSHALPTEYQNLMLSKSSSIKDFYPEDFEIDLNGKTRAWLGVVLLPFIDEKRLLTEIEKIEDSLNDEERIRNSLNDPVLYTSYNKTVKLSTLMLSLYMDDINTKVEISHLDSPSFVGFISKSNLFIEPSGSIKIPFKHDELKIIEDNIVTCCKYFYPNTTQHKSIILPNYKHVKKLGELEKNDVNDGYSMNRVNSKYSNNSNNNYNKNINFNKNYQNNNNRNYQRNYNNKDNYKNRNNYQNQQYSSNNQQYKPSSYNNNNYQNSNYNQYQQPNYNQYQQFNVNPYQKQGNYQQYQANPYQQPQNNYYQNPNYRNNPYQQPQYQNQHYNQQYNQQYNQNINQQYNSNSNSNTNQNQNYNQYNNHQYYTNNYQNEEKKDNNN